MTTETDTTKKTGSLRQLIEPKFLSLVEKGANRTGFKAIRNDDKAKPVMRSDHPLLSIILPADKTESDAYEIMELFGLENDYMVVERGEGEEGYMLYRKDVNKEMATTTFDLGDGFTADVDSASLAARADTGGGVVVTSIEFQKEHFPELNDVQGWLRGKDVDFKEGGVEVVDGGFIVTRHDTTELVMTKKVPVQDGVTAIIAQAERADIPAGVISPVSEYAYGSYGWGQLDFAAAMADPEFTSASWNALSTLGTVLEDIIFYSSMSIDERRVLIQRALGQFGDFMNGLLDALPQEVLIQIRSDNRKRRSFDMIKVDDSKSGMPAKKKDEVTEDAAREDAATEGTTTEETAAREDEKGTEDKTVASDDKANSEVTEDAERTDSDDGAAADEADDKGTSATGEFVTRSELEEVVNKAVGDALAKREDSTATALGGLQETMSKLVDSVADVKRSSEESNTALADKLADLESETVVRSDDDDHESDSAGSGSVFKGAIFGQRG